MHYMPWFTAPQNPGQAASSFGNGATGSTNKWGQHWTGYGAKFPDNLITVTDYTSTPVQVRDIWAHYHPLIGPYDGKDTAVLEYHMLLMKLSGIDGVMIDWYGKGGNGAPDAAPLLINSDALIKQTISTGLKFTLTVEDAVWKGITAATDNGAYIINNYFSKPDFVTLGDLRGESAANSNAPVLTTFGPQQFKSPGQWNTILGGKTGGFLPLYYQSAQIGADAGGEFAWPYPQAGLNGGGVNAWYANLNNYYTNTAGSKNIVLGTAFPGFKDFYGANGASTLGVIPRTYNGTTTLSATLALYTQKQAVLDGIQLATWNDFSEGTIIEPTVEEGFQSLDTIQKFTGVPYTEADLKEVYRLFTLRKKYIHNPSKQVQLNQVFDYFNSLQIPQASALMNIIDNMNVPQIILSSSGTPTENGAIGTITISATNITSDVTVRYSIGGTRGNSLYTVSPAFIDSVILTVAAPSVTFTVGAVDDAAVNQNKTVTLKLNADNAYNINGNDIAMLTVTDNETPPCNGVIIVNAVSTPTIDGAIDAVWSRAPANSIDQTISGTIQTGSTWQAMYDANNLYVLVQVKDSTLSKIGTSDWDQDGVEIYLAGNNSKAGAYTANDHQYRFNWNSLLGIQGNTGSKAGIQYAMPATTTGYNLEVLIPWATIGGTPPTNLKMIGFDININDQHNNAGQRESTAGWNGTAGDNYQNTANFGSVPLTVCTGDVVVAAPVISSVDTATAKEYNIFTYTILASNNPTSYTATGLPAGVGVNTATGNISGSPQLRGIYNVSITATNDNGTDTKQLIITVDSTPAVRYASVTATRQATGSMAIQWIINNEVAIQKYELQHSTDSVNFTTINTITTIANTNVDGFAYNSVDANASATANNYYRIKGTSTNTADGIYFSNIVTDKTSAVHYSSITATRQEAAVAIQFTVDSEILMQQYEVQSSADGINFATINTITTVGNNNANGVVYNSIDTSPSVSDIYYRIKGKSLKISDTLYYSDIVKVDQLHLAGVYPNPLTGNILHIPFVNQTTGSKYNVRLVNYMGQVLYKTSINIAAGNSVYPLHLNKKPAAGTYQLELRNEAGVRKVYKVVIENK